MVAIPAKEALPLEHLFTGREPIKQEDYETWSWLQNDKTYQRAQSVRNLYTDSIGNLRENSY
jgi:hypothetical protein